MRQLDKTDTFKNSGYLRKAKTPDTLKYTEKKLIKRMDELNNKVILLRKSLKSIINQTKINLIRKINLGRSKKQNVNRKESELFCFQNHCIKPSDIPLYLGLNPEKLERIITSPSSLEIDRVYAKILRNQMIQKTLNALKTKYGMERIEIFLRKNDKKIRKSYVKKKEVDLVKDRKNVIAKKEQSIKNNRMIKSNENIMIEMTKSLDPFFTNITGEIYFSSATNHPDDQDEIKDNVSKGNKFVEANRATDNLERNLPELNDLHPSWKAKRKMKQAQIQQFKGTKILFNAQ